MHLRIPQSGIFTLGLSLALMSCKPAPDPPESDLKQALTFYASFDEGFSADYAKGDPVLYTAASWDIDDSTSKVTGEEGLLRRLEQGGRSGGALRFSSDWNPVVFFKGKDNIAYQADAWAGSFSFWLRVDPTEGLESGYSDPFMITDKNWDNASLFVDFSEESPRHFRFAAFADHIIWNPKELSWDDFPAEDRPMIDVASLPFQSDKWTHVALTFDLLNSSSAPAKVHGYLNGEPVGTYEKQNLRISWENARVLIAMGRHYTGDLDDLAIFNRALTAAEVKALYNSPLIDLL